ncbi:hypothetical protein, variant [Aphanomyces astaci]|uniref:Uncharacterized protein n=1 Tax=Aphanomyces astaci TaxID=112090 RepID=W4G0X2_APHAT|nr:hypothetical protein, variant [Aphanomyces astaci]ETV73350.1 hypothetical protein, variant [Aphanomyces astaci]|eukprot:XP_009837224.1 hypothetical protein, variant [Aphanomyces astaci]
MESCGNTMEKDHVIDTLKAETMALKAELRRQSDVIHQVKGMNHQLQRKLKQRENDFEDVVVAFWDHTKRRDVKHHILRTLLVQKHAQDVAECLKHELDTIKFHCKSLRLQELQSECHEQGIEISVLREQVATLSATQYDRYPE